MTYAHHRRRGGFTAIETIVAVFILTFVGLLVGKLFMNVVRGVTSSHERRQAAALAQMVFEQYRAYATHADRGLAAYDTVNTTPQAFFRAPDNLGYDGLRITTVTKETLTGATKVEAKIAWGTGSQGGGLTFEKNFSSTLAQDDSDELSGI